MVLQRWSRSPGSALLGPAPAEALSTCTAQLHPSEAAAGTLSTTACPSSGQVPSSDCELGWPFTSWPAAGRFGGVDTSCGSMGGCEAQLTPDRH